MGLLALTTPPLEDDRCGSRAQLLVTLTSEGTTTNVVPAHRAPALAEGHAEGSHRDALHGEEWEGGMGRPWTPCGTKTRSRRPAFAIPLSAIEPFFLRILLICGDSRPT